MEITVKTIIDIFYVAASVIVFLIQRSHIKKLKDINQGMADYASTIDITKIKDYSSLSEEIADMKIKKFQNEIDTTISKQFGEMAVFIAQVLSHGDKETIEQIKKNYLPLTKEYFSDELLARLKNTT